MILNDPDANVVIRIADAADEQDRAHVRNGGGLCAFCGARLPSGDLCPHHWRD